MTAGPLTPPTGKALRLWPGIAAAIVLVLGRLVVPLFVPAALMFGVIGSVLCGFAIVVWWAFFSRAPRADRWGGAALMIGALLTTWPLVHVSIATGAMGGLLVMSALPTLGVAVVVAALATVGRSDAVRRIALATAVVIGCGVWTLVRTEGMTSDIIGSDFRWRWTPTAEERLLASAEPIPPAPAIAADPIAPDLPSSSAPAVPPPAAAPAGADAEAAVGARPEPSLAHAFEHAGAKPEWPGFRGAARDSAVRGVQIETDWAASPPVALWRRAVGPGWSSFAVAGDLFYTQEQRGDEEIVACYRVSTGEPVWQHRDPVRFWESNGGAGPRATPTLGGTMVYAFGATGILNALDARTGALAWSRNVASETGVEVPGWGFSSSPLIADDVVVVAAYGMLAAYDAATGRPRWLGPRHSGSYSSPQLITLDRVTQIVMLSGAGATGVAPADGEVLWEHAWSNPGGVIVQPALTPDGDLLINSIAMTGGAGIRRLSIKRESNGWTVTERWTSAGLKPYFNDFVVHGDHAYGFDGSILASISLADGTRTWKGGRYGNGQLVLIADQDLLLVTSEEGELVLVKATPEQFTELARIPALDGKTWNHPVLVNDLLLVRNGEEMAAFRLRRQRAAAGR
jgi:outer membrane protein assembly factor BamB